MKKNRRIVLLGVLALLAGSAYYTGRQIKLHRMPADIRHAWSDPQQVVVYSLSPRPARIEAIQKNPENPDAAFAGMDVFHQYRILGQAEVALVSDRNRIAGAVESAAASVFAVPHMCFSPRHGVRITSGGHFYDFLICYECHQMTCYDGDKKIASTCINGTSGKLDAVLASANLPVNQNAGEH